MRTIENIGIDFNISKSDTDNERFYFLIKEEIRLEEELKNVKTSLLELVNRIEKEKDFPRYKEIKPDFYLILNFPASFCVGLMNKVDDLGGEMSDWHQEGDKVKFGLKIDPLGFEKFKEDILKSVVSFS